MSKIPALPQTLLFFVLLFAAACSDQKAASANKEGQHKYTVLIGKETSPDYDKLAIGDEFGTRAQPQVMVHGNEPFGQLDVYEHGMKVATFDRGGVTLARNSTNFELKGRLESELNILVFEMTSAERGRLILKDKLKVTDALNHRVKLD